MAVADADPVDLALGDGRRDHGAAHAVQAGRLFDGFLQPLVGILERLAQHSRRVLLAELTGEGLVERGDDQITGDVAGGVPAHAVGHDDQRGRFGIPAVVVEISRQERVFLIIPGTRDLIARYFEAEFHASSLIAEAAADPVRSGNAHPVKCRTWPGRCDRAII